MPIKQDADSTFGTKIIRLFQKLMLDGRRHFQRELADWLNCSPQTIIRLTTEIEHVIGNKLQTGLDHHKRWYQICSPTRRSLGLDFEELRYIRICRDLADGYLPEQVKNRVDESIFRFSMLMSESSYASNSGGSQFAFFSKGRIDYTPHFAHIDQLLQSLETRTVCIIRYKGAGKKKSKEYRFGASRMICMNNALYVLGAELDETCEKIQRTLSLAVHRIVDVVLTDRRINMTIPDAEAGTFGLPWHAPKTFSIKFAPGRVSDYVRERIWADSQILEECEDEGVLLTITTRSKPAVQARFLL